MIMKDILKYKEYYGTAKVDLKNKKMYGRIIGINDLISYEGSSIEELIIKFEKSVDEYLYSCKILKKPPDRCYRGSFNIRVSP